MRTAVAIACLASVALLGLSLWSSARTSESLDRIGSRLTTFAEDIMPDSSGYEPTLLVWKTGSPPVEVRYPVKRGDLESLEDFAARCASELAIMKAALPPVP